MAIQPRAAESTSPLPTVEGRTQPPKMTQPRPGKAQRPGEPDATQVGPPPLPRPGEKTLNPPLWPDAREQGQEKRQKKRKYTEAELAGRSIAEQVRMKAGLGTDEEREEAGRKEYARVLQRERDQFIAAGLGTGEDFDAREKAREDARKAEEEAKQAKKLEKQREREERINKKRDEKNKAPRQQVVHAPVAPYPPGQYPPQPGMYPPPPGYYYPGRPNMAPPPGYPGYPPPPGYYPGVRPPVAPLPHGYPYPDARWGPPPPGYPPRPEYYQQPQIETKKAVKGYIAHVKEYQRLKQQERGFWGKLAHGMADPILVYVGAARLKKFVDEYRQHNGGKEPIFTDAVVKRVLDQKGKVDTQTVEASRAAEAAHRAMLKLAGASNDADIQKLPDNHPLRKKASDLIGEILAKSGGTLDQAAIDALAQKYRLNAEDVRAVAEGVAKIHQLGKDSGINFKTKESFQSSVSDQLLYGGLSPDQQKQARKVAFVAAGAATLAAARIIAIPFAGHISIGASIGLSTVSRASTLFTQEGVYSFNKARGSAISSADAKGPGAIDKLFTKTGLARMMAVDWDRGRKSYPWQILRAMATGAAVGYIGHGIGHVGEIPQGVEDLAHHVGIGNSATSAEHITRALDADSLKVHEINLPGVKDAEIRVPDGWHFGDIHQHQDPSALYDSAGDKVASHFTASKGEVHFQYDNAFASSHGIDTQHVDGTITSHAETDPFNEFVKEHSANVKVVNNGVDTNGNALPAGGHDAYGMTDYSNGNSLTIQSYDHLGDQANVLTTTVNGHQLVFLPTDHINGHPAWEFTPGDTTHTVTMWQDGKEIVVTSDQAASMLHITHGELQNWVNSGHPAGVSSDFDYSVGQNILGHNVVYGHLNPDTGVIQQLGQIRGHSANGGELSSTQYGGQVYEFPHVGGFSSHEEPGEVFATPQGVWVHDTLEQVADAGGRVTDFIFQHPILVGGTAASVVAGFMMGRSHRNNPQNKADMLFGGTGLGLTGALAAGIPYFVPGYPIGLAAGYLLGRIGKKGEGKEGGKKDGKAGEAGGRESGRLFFSDLPDGGGGDETGGPDVVPPGVGPRPTPGGVTPSIARSALQTGAPMVAPIAPAPAAGRTTPPPAPAPAAPLGKGVAAIGSLAGIYRTDDEIDADETSKVAHQANQRRMEDFIRDVQNEHNPDVEAALSVVNSTNPSRQAVEEVLAKLATADSSLPLEQRNKAQLARDAVIAGTSNGELSTEELIRVREAIPQRTSLQKVAETQNILNGVLSREDLGELVEAMQAVPEVAAAIAYSNARAAENPRENTPERRNALVELTVRAARDAKGGRELSSEEHRALGWIVEGSPQGDIDYTPLEAEISAEEQRQRDEEGQGGDTGDTQKAEAVDPNVAKQPNPEMTPLSSDLALSFTPREMNRQEAENLLSDESLNGAVGKIQEAINGLGDVEAHKEAIVEGYRNFEDILSAAIRLGEGDPAKIQEILEREGSPVTFDPSRPLADLNPHQRYAEGIVGAYAKQLTEAFESRGNMITGQDAFNALSRLPGEGSSNPHAVSEANRVQREIDTAILAWTHDEFPYLSKEGKDLTPEQRRLLVTALLNGNRPEIEAQLRVVGDQRDDETLKDPNSYPQADAVLAHFKANVLERKYRATTAGLVPMTPEEVAAYEQQPDVKELTPDEQEKLRNDVMALLPQIEASKGGITITEQLLQGLTDQQRQALQAIEGGRYMKDPDMLEYVLIPYLPNALMSAGELGNLIPMRTGSEKEDIEMFTEGVLNYLESRKVSDETVGNVENTMFALFDQIIRSQEKDMQKAYIVRLKKLLDVVLEHGGTAREISAVPLWVLAPSKDLYRDFIAEFVRAAYKHRLSEQDLVTIEYGREKILNLEHRGLEGPESDQDRKQIVDLLVGEERPQ